MSQVDILIARKVVPESVLQALPREGEEKPFAADARLTSWFGRHWTGKVTLHFLYKEEMLAQPMYQAIASLYANGKIDRVEHA